VLSGYASLRSLRDGLRPLSPDWCSNARLATPLLVNAAPAKLSRLRLQRGHFAARLGRCACPAAAHSPLATPRCLFRRLRFPPSSLRVQAGRAYAKRIRENSESAVYEISRVDGPNGLIQSQGFRGGCLTISGLYSIALVRVGEFFGRHIAEVPLK